MEEPSNSSLSPADSKKWIVRIVLALVLGQAIWALVVSLTTHLLLPLIARVMGGDPASPLYLGKGEIDVPGLFIAILEFCLAGIIAAVMSSWIQKGPKVVLRRVAAPVASLSLQSAVPVAKPPAAPVPAPRPVQAVQPAAPVTVPITAPMAAPVAAKPAPPPAAPPKPQKPKEVYYNSVGDPITMDDD